MNNIPVKTVLFFAWRKLWRCMRVFVCVCACPPHRHLEMAQRGLLSAAQAGMLLGWSGSPQSSLTWFLQAPRTLLLSKNTRSCSVVPFSFPSADTTISSLFHKLYKNPLCYFPHNFDSHSLTSSWWWKILSLLVHVQRLAMLCICYSLLISKAVQLLPPPSSPLHQND